jgi:hypothetical protein
MMAMENKKKSFYFVSIRVDSVIFLASSADASRKQWRRQRRTQKKTNPNLHFLITHQHPSDPFPPPKVPSTEWIHSSWAFSS